MPVKPMSSLRWFRRANAALDLLDWMEATPLLHRNTLERMVNALEFASTPDQLREGQRLLAAYEKATHAD